jgi:V8-like Glu-specific endopeptidase
MNAGERGPRRAARGILFVTLAAASLVPSSLAAPAAHASGHAVPAAQAREALSFWTPARMRRAKPLEVQMPGQPSIQAGAARSGAGSDPHRYPPLAAPGGASSSSAFEEVADSTAVDTRVNGVIFIGTPFGFGRCSGTSVNAPNYSVVFTAGHCIHGGGRFGSWLSGRWVFVPGYRYGQRPFGVFPAKWIDTTTQWRTTGSENFDVGAAVVTRNQRGQLLAKAVGGTGIAWGLKAKQTFDVHGYPAERPFNGQTQRVCRQTPFLGHDAISFISPGPLNLAVDCNVTGGASGGGWTIKNNVLNSVTNYGYPDDRGTDFGAYFGEEVGQLFRRAARIR